VLSLKAVEVTFFFLSKKKVTKEKSRGLVIFYEKFVLKQGQLLPKIPEAAFRTVIKGLCDSYHNRRISHIPTT
jgi:hypothetical protein